MELPVITLSPVSQSKTCTVGYSQVIECSVQSTVRDFYKLRWRGQNLTDYGKISRETDRVTSCPQIFTDTCEAADYPQYNKQVTLTFKTEEGFQCTSDTWGLGNEGDQVEGSCEEGKVGKKVATCLNRNWEVEDFCVLEKIQELLNQTEALRDPGAVPEILNELNEVTNELEKNVTESAATIETIVIVMKRLADISKEITQGPMEDILNTSSILTVDAAKKSWDRLNNRTYKNLTRSSKATVNSHIAASSTFLKNLEDYSKKFVDRFGNIVTDFILFNKTVFSNTFQEEYDNSVQIEIPQSGLQNNTITVLTFESLHNVVPPVNQMMTSNLSINAKVVLVQSVGVKNVSFTFDLRNSSLFSPQCVFWNFALFNDTGGWDNEGCIVVNDTKDTVTCQCNHLTSFSILMSPYANFSKKQQKDLEIITYIGVAISIASLIICLIIEAVVWKKVRKPRVSYMRHVTIVNIAVSLLCANIWFMIGAGISERKHEPSCTAATFFIHLFYLALFFWMLVSGLLLFYRTISVFDSGMRKGTMLAIGFSIGYGAPIIIAVVTVASTAGQKHYIQLNNFCWLNWNESKALLAFVIPALTIVVINFFILCVVIYKIIRRRTAANGANAEEKHVFMVIIRCLAFLTPFFGLTWCLGVATMVDIKDDNSKFGVHVSFAFFNSLQGFFVLLFGTLLDSKVRQEISKSSSSGATRSTTGGQTSSSGVLAGLRRWRDGYNISSNADSSVTNT
ncbi:adhesion G protein-coupled receptor F5-like [Boleophthalmus pectinirostris]|uniref:adhesion G protein-coupled receptor F5-like n=1 Tax=Boleophthalmus pectinirostris TaxID=150288 RepID=UPI00242F9D88|nr:adhesion G protein-coupled receptor F5-like [Boleophthalmus pectinirostris]